ncbi:hypothetical protein Hamer_G001317 [Homarus americanus]|uniref:Uncharacterized protein n=1 Tax=Homarus americanus TaxID=6706 RepID=A0A8J5N8U1_HOMAM|nr:hypothetical protein Hamer_G001317 [Homarus americanus]
MKHSNSSRFTATGCHEIHGYRKFSNKSGRLLRDVSTRFLRNIALISGLPLDMEDMHFEDPEEMESVT